MEAIIVIIGIIIAIVNATNKGKQVKKNAPGQAAKQSQPVTPPFQSPHRAQYEQMQTPVAPAAPQQPAAQPSAQPAGPGDFWKQVTELLDEEKEKKKALKPVKGHGQVTAMPEGRSRECEHGSVGGSIAFDTHQEGTNAAVRKQRAGGTARNAQAAEHSLYRPAMNAQEMRRAVVMAEILKRPQERMAEQARRWSVR